VGTLKEEAIFKVKADNLRTMSSIREEAIFEAKAEKMLAGQRELPLGRDFRWNRFRYLGEQTDDFGERWEHTFRCSPGSKEWMDKKYGKH